MTLDKLNSLSIRDARTFFTLCCGSKGWIDKMAASRPFTSMEELQKQALDVWNGLSAEDWKQAFAHHPKIGDIKSLRAKYIGTAALAQEEQTGVRGVSEKTLRLLYEGNQLYEAKFGYIFIVCATGKSAEEMLSVLTQRLSNYPDDEIRIAAGEQATITKLRLEKLLTENHAAS
jgi:2-oxo-4-hydroxy-4-carboxy-5-ureidoimidazoline decarboxylase